MKKVLIIYGTRFGTTQNTSEKIRVFLETKEIEVSINIEDKESFLSGFDGVLIGTGIKMSMWTKKIKKFIKKYKKELSNRNFKFGFFINCGTASEKKRINVVNRYHLMLIKNFIQLFFILNTNLLIINNFKHDDKAHSSKL